MREVRPQNSRSLQDIASSLASAKRVVVVTGAGVSTPCGISDFRSKTGLYNTKVPASLFNSPLANGKDFFTAATAWESEASAAAFYTFIASLRQSILQDVPHVSATHKFVRQLRDQRRLLRCYTQNIDGLERRAGLCTDLSRGSGSNRTRFTRKALTEQPGVREQDAGCEAVQLHGNLDHVRCVLCQKCFTWEDVHSADFQRGSASPCPSCAFTSQDRQDRGKRGTKVGGLRPNVVLYGEEHPQAETIGNVARADLLAAPDLLLVMGTSLQVHGVKTLVKEFARAVHHRARGKAIFVNLTAPVESVWSDSFDYWVNMDCDAWVAQMKSLRADAFTVQKRLAKPPIRKNVAKATSVKADVEAEKENADPADGKMLNRGYDGVIEKVSGKMARGLREQASSTRARCPNPLRLKVMKRTADDQESESALKFKRLKSTAGSA